MRRTGFSVGVVGCFLLVFGAFGAWHAHSTHTTRAQQGVGAGFKPALTRGAMPAAKGISSLPLEAQASISAALGRDLPAYQVRAMGTEVKAADLSRRSALPGTHPAGASDPAGSAIFGARNARNKLAADFTARGVVVHSGTARWKMALAGYGYGNDLKSVAAIVPTAKANRVEYRRGGLTEWYVNGPMGLEQGFTVNERPPATLGGADMRSSACLRGMLGMAGLFSPRRKLPSADSRDTQDDVCATPRAGGGRSAREESEPLTIALALSGDVTANADRAGKDVRAGLKPAPTTGGLTPKTDPTGKGLILSGPSLSPNDSLHPSLRYAGLTATDATGKELPASLELRGQELLLKVNDAGARYPVVIDPFVQLAQLTASDGGDDGLGYSVAISGNTVVAGAPDATIGSNQFQGAVYVFVEPSTGWANMTETAELTASDGQTRDGLGASVAISGNTIVAGAPQETIGSNSQQGAAYVFVEPTTGWVDMTETAKLIASDGEAGDNFGSSLALAARTLAVGAYQGFYGTGAAYVFVEPPAGWTTTSRFKAKLTASDGGGGLGTSIGISSGIVVVGAPRKPAVYVFVQPATGWASMTQTAELTAPVQRSGDLGFSVAISGGTVVAGSPTASPYGKDSGAADVFVEPATGWVNMTPTAVLTTSDENENFQVGVSVAINDNTVVVGAPLLNAAYVFLKPAGGWVNMHQTGELIPSNGQEGEYFGVSVVVSGSTVVAGASFGGGDGAAYVFGDTP